MVGETLRVPAGVTVPTPWSILTDVASVVDHVRVEAAPEATDVGDAVTLAVGSGGGGAVTVTVAVLVAVPVALVAVIV